MGTSLEELTIEMLMLLAPRGLTPSEARTRARLAWRVAQAGDVGATWRDIVRALRDVPVCELQRVFEGARSGGLIESLPVGPGPRGGRPTVRYRVARSR